MANETNEQKPKHAPGPWQIGFDDGSGVDEYYIVDPNDNAVVHGQGDCCKIGGIRDEANALLIAAAPLMLEALQELEWAWNDEGGNRCLSCRGWADIKEHRAHCRLGNAIQSVTGESPV